MNVTDLPANMQSKIIVNESGCWHWTAAVNSRNYGQVGVDGVSKSTHRVKRRAGLPIGDDRHGKANGYITYGCKCEPCSAAYRDYRTSRRRAS